MNGTTRESALPDLSYYQQPGGCVEVNQDGDDVVHFCSIGDARTFLLAEFAAFVDDAEARRLC